MNTASYMLLDGDDELFLGESYFVRKIRSGLRDEWVPIDTAS